MIIVNPKAVYPGKIPQYESNTQALATELKVGTLYHNTSGQVFIVMEGS